MVAAAHLNSPVHLNGPRPHVLAAVFACALTLTSTVWSQTSAPVAPKASAPAVLAPLATSLRWSELTKVQQEALQPLAQSWASLTLTHRRKWVALAQGYPSLSAENKEKLHSRMVEWAALTPAERQVARLNFAETKKLPTAERAAVWEAYQALSPQERQKLAEQAAKQPIGAAIAIKPNAPDKLATVPVTRHTPEIVRKEATAKQGVNEKTLLPQVQRPAPVASEPEAEPNPTPTN